MSILSTEPGFQVKKLIAYSGGPQGQYHGKPLEMRREVDCIFREAPMSTLELQSIAINDRVLYSKFRMLCITYMCSTFKFLCSL
jgi:hypothetical protein